MFYKKLSNNLARWGKKSQKLPTNNDVIKQNVLNSLRPTLEEVKIKQPFAWRWLMVAAVPALVILLMISYNKTMREIPIGYVENEFDTGLAVESSDRAVGGGFGVMATQKTGLSESASISEKIMGTVSDYVDSFSRHYYSQSPDITDTREYLKTTFGLDIKTRKVEKTYTRVKTIIRGYGGRIDNSSLSEKYARLSFVVPKSDYDSFVEEVQGMFPEKFIKLSENTSNLLPQKQHIEEQTEQTNKTLDELKQDRTDLVKNHEEKVASLQKEVNRLNGIIYSLMGQRKDIPTTDTIALQKINEQINYNLRLRNTQNESLNNENNQYQKNLNALDQRISAQENRLIELDKQDTNLLNNVETVDGTISIRWISLFEIVNLYIPVYKTLIILFVLIIIFYLFVGHKSKEIQLP